MLRRDWLRRELNTLEIFVLARNDAQSTFYLLIGFIALYAGEYTLLIVTYSLILMIAIVLAYGEMGSHFPETGGSYLYVKYSLGPMIGYISAWLLALDQIIMISYGTLDASIYLTSALRRLGVDLGVPVNVLAFLFTTILFLITLIGIRESSRVALLVAFFDLLIVLPLILIANLIAGVEIELPEFKWSGVEPYSLLFALALASRGFTGIDSIGQLAGEARAPLLQIPRAAFLVIIAMISASLSLTVLIMSRVPFGAIAESPELALLILAENTPYVGGLAAIFMALNLILIMMTAALAGYVSFSRLTYMLAEEGHLPRFISAIHGRFRTPHRSLFIAYVISVVLVMPGELKLIVEVYAIASLVNYLLVSLSLGLIERKGKLYGGLRSPRIANVPTVSILGVTLTSMGLTLSIIGRYHVLWILGLWLVAGLLLRILNLKASISR